MKLRSIHHFACTGGTLISRAVAALPAVRLLSEVDPLSSVRRKNRFAPTDVVALARDGSNPPSQEGLVRIFQAGLRVLAEASVAEGLHLVIRSHEHNRYCTGSGVAERPSVHSILGSTYEMTSLLTVRHPIDSYLSLQNHGWLHFNPSGLSEYCKRYSAFLEDHADLPRLRYEDFVADPDAGMQQICALLDLPFDASYRRGLADITLSGDSGRKSDQITPRPRRWMPKSQAKLFAQNKDLSHLCEDLGYA
jgi:hypothetical protein